MLQLAGRIGLGVDVADLLQLQRALERDRVMQPAAEKQRVLLARELLRPRDHLRLECEHRLQRRRQMSQRADVSAFRFFIETAALFRQRQCQQEQRNQLRRRCLGRSDSDFDTGTREVLQLGLPRHRAGRHVDDAERVRHAE